MKLSIVIVNYNVKYFLHQSLKAVFRSKVNFDYEVFVVDNASVDGSVEMVKQSFPEVRLICSPQNLGFSKGNNLAIKQSNAKYILLLNPDTIIREDTLQKVVEFMEQHPEAGALGVKMLDGQGKFLPESKRGFPTPQVAFYKMSGLSKLFPKSHVFGRYHLGFLDKDQILEVDVLSGAFMLLRKSVLDEIGSLDEDYFMYGEDIDLSYRIQQAGYKNYYYPYSPIIHFKGESTKKGSLNYVKVFYQAMIIFAQKHFKNNSGKRYIFLLNWAIYFRAALAMFNNIVTAIGRQVLDVTILAGTFVGASYLWENWIRKEDELRFSSLHFSVNLPIYIFIWLTINYLVGVYEKSVKLIYLWIGMLVGTFIIGAVYGFFPNEWRSSRGVILFTFVLGTLFMTLYRLLWAWKKGRTKELLYNVQDLIIVGSADESKRIIDLLQDLDVRRNYLGFISPFQADAGADKFLGTTEYIQEVLSFKSVDEIIFCAKDISSMDMIHQIASLKKEINFKIVAEESDAIIGSHSKDTSGELLTYDVGYKINRLYIRRLKRFMDICISIILLLLSPLLLGFQKYKVGFLKNIFYVGVAAKTWVGYSEVENPTSKIKIPKLPKGVLHPMDRFENKKMDIPFTERQNYLYAKEYSIFFDIQMIVHHWKKLGAQ